MSGGTAHSSASIGLAAGVLIGYGCAYYFYPDQVVWVAAGSLAGIIITPDWDVDAGSIANWYIRKSLGRGIETIFRAWIAPYALILKHRSFLSHFPVISTLFRLIYLAVPAILIPLSMRHVLRVLVAQAIAIPLDLGLLFLLSSGVSDYLIPFILGIAISDTLHYIFDHIF